MVLLTNQVNIILLVSCLFISQTALEIIPRLDPKSFGPYKVNNSLLTSTLDSGVTYDQSTSKYSLNLTSLSKLDQTIELQLTQIIPYKGMRVDSPNKILFNLSFNSSPGTIHKFSVKTVIYLQSQINQSINQINVYFAIRGYEIALGNQQSIPTFNICSFNALEVPAFCYPRQNFSGSLSISHVLSKLSCSQQSPRILLNRTISSISHIITVLKISEPAHSATDQAVSAPSVSTNHTVLEFSAIVAPFPKNIITRTYNTSIGKYFVYHDVPKNLDQLDYGNLTTQLQPTLLQHFKFSSSMKQSPDSNSLILKSTYIDDYIGIGIINGKQTRQPLNPLTIPINSGYSIFADFNYQIKPYSNSLCAVCFTIYLKNNQNPPADLSSSYFNNVHATVQICPFRNISYQDGILDNNTQFNYLHFNLKKAYGIVKAYIFSLKQLGISRKKEEVNFDLMKYVRLACQQTPTLWNYSIVGIRFGCQVYSGKIQFQLINLEFKFQHQTNENIIISCPLGQTSDPSNQSCKMNKEVDRIVSPMVGIPNAGLLLKTGPFIGLLDDLSYFVYHNSNYDKIFKYFSEISWNWTNSKWQPPFGLGVLLQGQVSSTTQYSRKWIKDTERITPNRLKWTNEDLFFLNNCKGYLFYTVPTSILLFLFLLILHKIFKQSYPKIANLLVSFSSWAYLLIALLGDNLQYLAFRSFEQFRYLVPNKGVLSLVSIILALITNFFAIICTGATYFLALKWTNVQFKPVLLKKHYQACFFLHTWMLARFFFGFIHAYLDCNITRLFCILLLQAIVVISSAYSSYFARYKSSLSCMVFGQIVRFFLYLVVFLEILFPELVNILSNHFVIAQLSYILSITLFVVNGFQIVLHIFVGFMVKLMSNKAPKKAALKESKCRTKRIRTAKIRKHVTKKFHTQRNPQIQLKQQRNRKFLQTKLKAQFKVPNPAKNIIRQVIQTNQDNSEEKNLKQNPHRSQFDSNSVVEMLKQKQNHLKQLARMKYKSQQNKQKLQRSKTHKQIDIKTVRKVKDELELKRHN